MKTIKVFGNKNASDLVEVSVGDIVFDEVTRSLTKVITIEDQYDLIIDNNVDAGKRKAWQITEVLK